MSLILNRFLFFIVFVIGFQLSLKAQGETTKISKIETKEFESIIDSIHQNYEYYNYPQLIKRLAFIGEIARKEGNKQLWISSRFYMADIFYKACRNKEAEKILNYILENNDAKDFNEMLLPFSYYLYTKILLDKGEVEAAKKMYEKSQEAIKNGKSIHSFIGDFVYAKILYKEKKLEEALTHVKNVEAKIKDYPSSYFSGEIYYLKSQILKDLKSLEIAAATANKVYYQAHVNKYEMQKLRASELLVDIYTLLNDHPEQIHYLNISNTIRDSIIDFQNAQFTEDKLTDSQSIQSAVNTISKLSLANSEQEKSIKYNQLTIILSALFIAILSLFTVSLYKNNNLRAKANALLKQKNSELIESREKSLTAMRYREQFLSTITHELRTPIYAVTGLTYLLLKENPTPQQEEHLKSLKHSGEHLLSLINNILDINKLESNKLNKVEVDFDIKDKLKSIVESLRRSAKENGNSLHLEIDSKLPSLLRGDVVKLSQVLINLISNAIKFTNNGDIWVRLSLIKETDYKVFIQFEVEDNGKGIAKEHQKAIFEKFNQGTNEMNSPQGGTGLGLPIVKNLLKFLNSDIELESRLGEGSKFFFKISYDKAENMVLAKANGSDNNFIKNKKSLTEVFKDKKILVVEDNKLNQKITCKIL